MPGRGERRKRRERGRVLDLAAGRGASRNQSEAVYGALRRGEAVVAVDARWELTHLAVNVWTWQAEGLRAAAARARVTLAESVRQNLCVGGGLEPPGPLPPVPLAPPQWRGAGGPYAKREITVQGGPDQAAPAADDPARRGAGTGDEGASA